MRSVLLLTVLLFISADAQEDKYDGDREMITIPIESADQSKNDIDGESSNMFSAIADQLNCTNLQINHKGIRTEETIFLRPLTTTKERSEVATNVPWDAASPRLPRDFDDVTWSPENEANEDDVKPRSKISADDPNPSKNVTFHHNYSTVKKYPEEILNLEMEKNMTRCTAPFDDDGQQFYWYQIITENGGSPGEVNATMLTPNVTQVLNPCERPIEKTVPPLEDLLYKYELIELDKVYRREEAFLRFAGTPSEFVDIHGHFVWSPPQCRRRYHSLEYRKDDTGFYIEIHRKQKCVFVQNLAVSIRCDQADAHARRV